MTVASRIRTLFATIVATGTLMALPAAAHASLVISSTDPTSNVTLGLGQATANSDPAILNASDIDSLLVAGDTLVSNPHGNVEVEAGTSTVTSNTLTFDSSGTTIFVPDLSFAGAVAVGSSASLGDGTFEAYSWDFTEPLQVTDDALISAQPSGETFASIDGASNVELMAHAITVNGDIGATTPLTSLDACISCSSGGMRFNQTTTVTTTGHQEYYSNVTAAGALTLTSTGDEIDVNGALTTGGALTIDSPTYSNVTGSVSGLSFAKQGSGQLILANGVSGGAVDVSAGTLEIDGTSPSSITVESGATLSGTAALSGQVTVAAGGTVAPGSPATPGTMNVTNLAASSGTLSFQVAGSSASQIAFGSGSFNGAILNVDVDSAPTAGKTYTIVSQTGSAPTGQTFAGVGDGSLVTADGYTFLVNYEGGDGNDVTLTYLALPATLTIGNAASYDVTIGAGSVSPLHPYSAGLSVADLDTALAAPPVTVSNPNGDIDVTAAPSAPGQLTLSTPDDVSLAQALAFGGPLIVFAAHASSGSLSTSNGLTVNAPLTLAPGANALTDAAGTTTLDAVDADASGSSLTIDNSAAPGEVDLEGDIGATAPLSALTVLTPTGGGAAAIVFDTAHAVTTTGTQAYSGDVQSYGPVALTSSQQGVSIAGNVQLGDSLTVDSAGASSIAGTIADTAPGTYTLTKQGVGTLTLTGAANSSAIADHAGNVQLDGTATSTIDVSAGATLSGTGTATGTISATAANATLSPGDATATGTLHTGKVALGGGTLAIHIDGTGASQLDVDPSSGGVSLAGATLSLTASGTIPDSHVYTIVSAGASTHLAGTFAGLPEGSAVTAGGTTFTISYADGNVTLMSPPPPTVVTQPPATPQLSVSTNTPPAAPFVPILTGLAPMAASAAHVVLLGLITSTRCNERCRTETRVYISNSTARRDGILVRGSHHKGLVLVGGASRVLHYDYGKPFPYRVFITSPRTIQALLGEHTARIALYVVTTITDGKRTHRSAYRIVPAPAR